MHHLRQLWVTTTSSLWFVPSAMVAAAIGLATGLTAVDLAIGSGWTARHSVLFGVGAAGARGMLSAIAGSMMTVASLSFSLTISTLATAASQYTSRLIRNFMRDRVNQFVLGFFVGLFAYCLVVLRTIRGGDEGQFVPSLAVMGGLVLALLSIGVLIYFIHHMAESIQAGTILGRVTAETVRAVDVLFPAGIGEAAGPSDETPPAGPWHPISAGRFGFVQSVDADDLLRVAGDCGTVVRMAADVGSFVTPAGAVCEVAGPTPPDAVTMRRLRAAYEVGAARTIEQDAAFGVRQIVDIALKALSPGINDTTTGVMCVEHLSVILEAVAARPIPGHRRAADGTARLQAAGQSFDALAGLCLDQVRQNAGGNPAVLTALLRAAAAAGRRTADPGRRRTLAAHARHIANVVDSTLKAAVDRDPVRRLADDVLNELR